MDSQPNDTARAESLPAGEHEARAHDWQPVIDAIGTHPDLDFNEGTWRVLCLTWMADIGEPVFVEATPATVDALMLAHATAWLDRQGSEGIAIIPIGAGAEFYIMRDPRPGQSFTYYPDRIAATIAAVVAAKGGSDAD